LTRKIYLASLLGGLSLTRFAGIAAIFKGIDADFFKNKVNYFHF
jgi:hypothetical protein